MPRLKDLTGLTFGDLTVLRRDGHKGKKVMWLCRCQCGREKSIFGSGLTSGRSRTCGCSKTTTADPSRPKHGASRSPEYKIWCTMKRRCTDPSSPTYKRHGARGITVCQRWLHSFADFIADMGPRPSAAHSIDRIDNEGNYEPGNCRWATREEQMGNTRHTPRFTHQGTTKTLVEWAAHLGINTDTLRHRLMRKKWPVDLALTTPVCQARSRAFRAKREPHTPGR